MNTVNLVGRLSKEVEVRYTQAGKAVGAFSMAVNRPFTNSNGEREADFFNCVIWGKSAENLANFVSKGSQLAVVGRLQTRNYENNQGNRVYVTEVVVENFTLIESRTESEQRRQSQEQAPQTHQNNGNVLINLTNKMAQTLKIREETIRLMLQRIMIHLVVVKK